MLDAPQLPQHNQSLPFVSACVIPMHLPIYRVRERGAAEYLREDVYLKTTKHTLAVTLASRASISKCSFFVCCAAQQQHKSVVNPVCVCAGFQKERR